MLYKSDYNYRARRVLLICASVMFASVLLFCIVKNVKASPNETSLRTFHCDSVLIEANDSLWTIASRYFTDEYEDMNNYIKILKEANGLKSDTIHEGCYLTVPFYR